MKKNKFGFTLVELLAVIVVLALILIIAVPKITKTLDNSKKRTLELSVKSIVKSAEKAYIENKTYGVDEVITCESVADISKDEYEICDIVFDIYGEASVTFVGKGSYNGLNVCEGTNDNVIVENGTCISSFVRHDWSTIVSKVKSGIYPYKVGDEKILDLGDLGVYTIRVANTTPCNKVSRQSKSACGFVLEFKDIVTKMKMNYSNFNGWPGTLARTFVNETIYNAMPEDLRKGIIDTTVISSYGSDSVLNSITTNFTSIDKLYLLSPEEVYGESYVSDADTSLGTSRQLDFYSENNVTRSNYSGAVKKIKDVAHYYWLRSAILSYNGYLTVDWDGRVSNNDSSAESGGISPAFRLAE